MKTLIKLSAAVLFTFNFLLSTFYCLAQANQPGSGNCLDFDGVNDYVEVADDNSLDFGTGDFTIEVWKKGYTHTGRLIAKRPYPSYLGYELVDRNDKISVFIGDGSIYFHQDVGTTNINDNLWHHIVVVWDGTTDSIKVYLDGMLDGLREYPGINNIDNTSNLYIGRWSLGQYYGGLIDEVRIWNYARSQTEIREDMCKKLAGNEPGLVGYWRMDEGSGNTAFDSSPNNNNGTLQ